MRVREETGLFLNLGARRRGEADLLVEAITRGDERIRFLVKSGRKGKASFTGRFLPLARLRGRWVRGLAGRWRLVEAHGEEMRLSARRDLGKTGALSALAEIVVRTLPPGAPTEGLYDFLDAAAAEILSARWPDVAYRARLVALLGFLGFTPETEECPECGSSLDNTRFDLAEGILKCPSCAPASPVVPAGVLSFLRRAATAPAEVRARFRLRPETARPLDEFLAAYLGRHLEIRLASRAFLSAAGYDLSR